MDATAVDATAEISKKGGRYGGFSRVRVFCAATLKASYKFAKQICNLFLNCSCGTADACGPVTVRKSNSAGDTDLVERKLLEHLGLWSGDQYYNNSTEKRTSICGAD